MRKIKLLTLGFIPLLLICPKKDLTAQTILPEIERKVDSLVKIMTLYEKVSQLYAFRVYDTLAWDDEGNFKGIEDSERLKLGVGTFWSRQLFGLPVEKRVKCINSFQEYLLENTRLGIPAFVFAEGLHGYMSQGATSFPQAIALGCTWDTLLAEKIYTVTSLEASSCGVTQFLSPVIDLARDPRWGRTEECFSEDPYLVSRMGLAAVYGFQGRGKTIDENHAAVTLKHFAGHGQPEGGRNIAPVYYSDRYFRETHLYPFEIAVKKGNAQSIMASYNEWDGVPNHINHKLLTEILRDEWGFKGYVMSDGGGMDVTWREHLAAKDSAESGILSMLAGVDYDLSSTGSYVAMADHVKAGIIPPEVLDHAVRNVLRVKFTSGMFDHPYADPSRVSDIINCEEHKALALEAAHKAAVLLKNEDGTLPLDPKKIKTLAVIGPNAAQVHLGGYSAFPMLGVSALEGFEAYGKEHGIKIMYAEGCKITLNEETHWQVNEEPVMSTPEIDQPLIDEAVKTAEKSDAVVLLIGENELVNREAWSEKHEGDVNHLNLVGAQLDLAKALLKTGKPVIVILINGRPLSINYLAEHAPAIIEAWYLGQETGHALADLVFGEVNPSGKLSVTIPRNVGQIPCFYDHQPSRFREYVNADSSPLYPFGYGLSYTDFDYSDLKLSKKEIMPDGELTVSVKVSNSGKMKGEEIVQLYIHDLVSVPVRPVMELKDFTKISLKPGETKTVTFLITPEKLQALDLDMKRTVQAGEFEIMVGKSSVDVLKDVLVVK
ncbi:MAG: glycoside hydrolase family 3 C-terminal domain-containing protein [Bacteroidales bacterium]|nr:glycoside hydrolase family 3 C-terminal domain-containing protein [Bacteroidales bacterium]